MIIGIFRYQWRCFCNIVVKMVPAGDVCHPLFLYTDQGKINGWYKCPKKRRLKNEEKSSNVNVYYGYGVQPRSMRR